ncbi:hypothetical protein PMIN01_09937 [Paraphaeosphaeria minitans]|uniref:DUF7053 domain-containing protein n=1 Tax=Paraphaeosphaeria minitans TaxID=565426 RepID=A0A9P6KLY6_9PLEO|nr:hypothetical protein PMIN01_09937 [Paraphaeosphaeria minitans]
MSRTSVFTTCTPLPAGLTRQSVLDMYHAHTEMIELNPLVIERFKCKAPSYAPAEEHHATWYTIKDADKVNYLPGGLASSSVSYHACFHDLSNGLQTHVYAPLGLDIRAKWTVGGSLPGEPKPPAEMGIGAPREGLYIREDVRMKCNIMMMGFVKKTFKESHSTMVDRLVEKAHVLESRQANERLNALKNLAPGERMGHGSIFIAPPPGYGEERRNYKYDDKPLPLPREGVHSDGSARSSPGLSQASTLTSPSEFPRISPQFQHRLQRQRSQTQSQAESYKPYQDQRGSLAPSHWKPGHSHSHSHSQDCNHTSGPQLGAGQVPSPRQPNPQAQTLPSLSYLPSTVYNPHASNARDSQYQAYQPPRSVEYLHPPPAELPAHMQDSPTLPRTLRGDGDEHPAELPA